MDEQKQDDSLEITYNSSVPIQDVTLKTNQKRWTIEKFGEKGSGISMLKARHHNEDDMYLCVCMCMCMYRDGASEKPRKIFFSWEIYSLFRIINTINFPNFFLFANTNMYQEVYRDE